MTSFSAPASSVGLHCAAACRFTNTSPTACLLLLRTCFCTSSYRNITPAIALSAAKCSPACPCSKIAPTSFSITRCLPSASTSVSASARFLARLNISRKPPPLIFAAVCSTVSECSRPLFNSHSSAWELFATRSLAKRERLWKRVLTLITRVDCRLRHRGANLQRSQFTRSIHSTDAHRRVLIGAFEACRAWLRHYHPAHSVLLSQAFQVGLPDALKILLVVLVISRLI